MPVSTRGPLLNTDRSSLFSDETSMMDRLLQLDQLRDLYRRASQGGDDYSFHRNLLADLQVSCQIDPADLRRIPASGAVLAVANHPFGMLEGSLLNTRLPEVRTDYKIMTNHLLASLPELESHCIFVDPFDERGAKVQNSRALKQAIQWLKGGHMLVIFPAGEVSSWNFKHGEVEDPKWSDTVARLIRIAKCPAISLFFKGTNSIPFHLLGMMHPRLRTARLPHELLNKRGKSIEIRVGSLIPCETITSFSDETNVTDYLRWRTYLLANRGETRERLMPKLIKAAVPKKVPDAIIPEQDRGDLVCDLMGLRPEQLLEETREFAVYLADAAQIPSVLKEIGRLREITFRAVGEGTGKPSDLDTFDPHYRHLILWSKLKDELVGSYRVGEVTQILSRFGPQGLYTNTLFQYSPRFFDQIGPALELGRSFVRPEYQKKYSPLLLLWKGLARYISQNPKNPVLFGAVSISNDYNPVSRELCVRFLQDQEADEGLAGLVRARKPFRYGDPGGLNDQMMRNFFRDLDSLSTVVADVERDGKGIPILLKQYLKLGGKLLGFNIDPRFSDALDGLMLVDLRKTEPEILERYMGRVGAADFLKNAVAPMPLTLSATA